LIKEFGVDGAMIATAAEANSSCFRRETDGGLAPWKEVVEQYLKISMEVENRWGNTKYLLGHLIPGKVPIYQQMTGSKSYHQACKVLALEQLEAQAEETDERLGITLETEYQGRKGKKNKSAIAAGGIQGKVRHEPKKSLSERGIPNRAAVALNV